MIIAPPLDQQWMRISESFAKSGLDKKGIAGSPQLTKKRLITPYCVLKTHNQTMAEETTGTIDGIKKSVRKKGRPTKLVLSRQANRKAVTMPEGTPSST